MLRPVQFLFTVILLSNASSLLRLTHEQYDHWISRCGYGDAERKDDVGWFVVVHNRVTQKYDGGAVISPKHVLAARASVGTRYLKSNFTKKGSPYFQQLTEKFKVQHVIYNFAVLEIENEFPAKVGKVCLNMHPAKSIAAKTPIDVVYLASTTTHAYQKKPIEFGIHDQNCYELHCEDLLKSGNTKKGEPGDPWFRTINGRDQLLGVGLGDGVATSISYWSDFLCMLIGACVSGYEEESPMKHSDFPYFFDGVFQPYFKEPACSNEHRLQLIRQSTSFTRLTKTEQRSLKAECGQTFGSEHPATGSELVNLFLVTILSEKKECHMHGIMQDCDLEDQREMFECAGKSSDLSTTRNQQCELLENDDLFPIRYHPSKVGKRWIRVAKVVVPYVDIEERKNDLDIALVQLEQRIPLESYIKPICIKKCFGVPRSSCCAAGRNTFWYAYPLALITQTCGVYFTVLVSVHRYLGVCHPFRAKRWVTHTLSRFPPNPSVSHTIVMFLVPFAVLIVVNIRIIIALKQSTHLRSMHSSARIENRSRILQNFQLLKASKYSDVFSKFSKLSNVSPGMKPTPSSLKGGLRDSLLLAIVLIFLICNVIPFLNNCVEAWRIYTSSDDTENDEEMDREPQAWFDISVELGNILISLNSSSSLFVYLFFSSKYRSIIKQWLGLQRRTRVNGVALTTAMAAQKALELGMFPEEAERPVDLFLRERRRSGIGMMRGKGRGVVGRPRLASGGGNQNKMQLMITSRTSSQPESIDEAVEDEFNEIDAKELSEDSKRTSSKRKLLRFATVE